MGMENYKTVLIVAKCIVNSYLSSVGNLNIIVLIVAKCIVNITDKEV